MSFIIENNEEYLMSFVQGEERGYDFIFRQFFTALCFFATKILKDEDNAKDIVQDCFLNLWNNHTTINKPTAIKSFLYMTVRNACLNFLRKKKQTDKRDEGVKYLSESTDDNWLDQVTHAEMMKEIYLHIQSLPPKMQEVFRKYYIEGKATNEISNDLQILPDTVRQQKTKALAILREKMGVFLLVLFFL